MSSTGSSVLLLAVLPLAVTSRDIDREVDCVLVQSSRSEIVLLAVLGRVVPLYRSCCLNDISTSPRTFSPPLDGPYPAVLWYFSDPRSRNVRLTRKDHSRHAMARPYWCRDDRVSRVLFMIWTTNK